MSEPSGPLIFTDGVQVADSIAFAACCIPPALLVEARRLIDDDARIACEFGLQKCGLGCGSTASIEGPMAGRSFPHGLENSDSEASRRDVVGPGAVLAAVLSGGNLGVSTISRRGQEAEAAKLFARAARGAALKAALWRFDEERSVHEEASFSFSLWSPSPSQSVGRV
eukprot:s1296_g5.t1